MRIEVKFPLGIVYNRDLGCRKTYLAADGRQRGIRNLVSEELGVAGGGRGYGSNFSFVGG